MNKRLEFIRILDVCGLMELGYSGQQFTWCNQRAMDDRIWKRLDRDLVNDNWLQSMSQTTITHLPSMGSDHCPLLMELIVKPENNIRYFKFLNC